MMKDLINKLNSIDVGALLKQILQGKRSAVSHNLSSDGAEKSSSALTQTIDRLLYKVDKKLLITVGLAVILITWGVSSVFSSLSTRGQLSELELTLSQLESENIKLTQQMAQLRTDHKTLFEAAKTAPASANELLSRVSDVYGRAGMTVLKVVTGTTDKPDFIQIEAEGPYRSIQYVLNEILKLSSALEVKNLQFGSDPNKGLLQMSIGFQFVKPPQLLGHKIDHPSYAYLDGLNQSAVIQKSFMRRVQFVPQTQNSAPVPAANPANATSPNNASSSPSTAPAAPTTSSSGGLDRNPFYIPPSPGGAAAPMGAPMPAGGVDLSRGFGASAPTRGEGIYVTGCMIGTNKRACLFQLMDGSTGLFSVGQSINKDIKLIEIRVDEVTVQMAGKPKKIKIGEQVR